MGYDECKHTGAYVVIHHGPDGTDEMPVFLVDPCKAGSTPHHYTENLCRADVYAYYAGAKRCAERENEYLKQIGHPLAGHIEVGELFVRDYEPKGE